MTDIFFNIEFYRKYKIILMHAFVFAQVRLPDATLPLRKHPLLGEVLLQVLTLEYR